MNNGWLLPPIALFPLDLDREMARRYVPLACVSSDRRSAASREEQDRVVWKWTLAYSPVPTDSCFARSHTGIRLPHFWHPHACAPIRHLSAPTARAGHGSVRH